MGRWFVGKPGFVYQAANFLYGGFIWTQIYINNKGEKIHLTIDQCDENVQFKLEMTDFLLVKRVKAQRFSDHKGM